MKTSNVKKYNSVSINKIIITIVITAILIQGVFWLADSIYLFRSEIEDLEQIQTDYIKAELKERVASVIDYSDYRSKETETVLREALESRTYEAYALMTRIYENNKFSKSKEEITLMIQDALRDIRFNDGRGYFFIDTLKGDVILYPVFPQSEGTNIIDLRDDKGNYTLQDEIDLVKAQGEGFIEGYWKNPNAGDDIAYKKITFVKAFEPYGWYLGCGDYLDEIEKEIQAEVIAYVDSIQYGDENQQYVFLHDYAGVELANGVYPEMVGLNNYHLQDINGNYIYQEQIIICQEDGGGYLTHYWPNVDDEGVHKKLTYVAPLDNWSWVIGTGVDLSSLDALIESKESSLNQFIITRVFTILLILISLVLVSMLYVRHFTTKVKRNFSVFRDSMLAAKQKLMPIDVASLDYEDFSELAEVTNSMTDRINELLHYDELTGAFNRRYFKSLFDLEFIDGPDTIGLISMDIDYFKSVNDSFGHDIGDITLIRIANLIKEETPENGYVARFGGEEFIILLPDTTFEASIEVAERIRQRIENHHITEIKGHVTISGGVVYSGSWGKDEIFKQADKKLYEAKAKGRNRIEH